MKAIDIMKDLFSVTDRPVPDFHCDTCKAGDPEREVKKVASVMFPTPNVIRAAAEWGADLLITHEPIYYNHTDEHSDEAVESAKRRIVEESGMTVYRYHDHPHVASHDIIAAGELEAMGLAGEIEYTDTFDLVRIHLQEPITAKELAKLLMQRLNIRCLRVAGAGDVPCDTVSGMFGAPGEIFDELRNEKCEILICGEGCEWQQAEYARDAAELGFKKAIIYMGHAASERDGMVYTAELIKKQHPELEVKYFECGEACYLPE